jgi:hypothetical protein
VLIKSTRYKEKKERKVLRYARPRGKEIIPAKKALNLSKTMMDPHFGHPADEDLNN